MSSSAGVVVAMASASLSAKPKFLPCKNDPPSISSLVFASAYTSVVCVHNSLILSKSAALHNFTDFLRYGQRAQMYRHHSSHESMSIITFNKTEETKWIPWKRLWIRPEKDQNAASPHMYFYPLQPCLPSYTSLFPTDTSRQWAQSRITINP